MHGDDTGDREALQLTLGRTTPDGGRSRVAELVLAGRASTVAER
jgi:hypothetical protein